MEEGSGPVTREEAQQMLADARAAMVEMKQELREAKLGLFWIIQGNGGDVSKPADLRKAKEEFQAGLKVHVITDGDDPRNAELMTRMYDLYARVFPLEEEREELGKLLGMNKTKSSDAPSLEQWILLEDSDGNIIGARNVMNLSAVGQDEVSATVEGTQSLVYSFVDPKFRSMGLGEYTLSIAEKAGREFIASTYPGGRDPDTVDMLQVAEQNAPLNLTMEAMLVDTKGAKTDQFWRREYYESLKFRELDFGYVQVPLVPAAEGGEPADGLNLIVRHASGPKSGRGQPDIMTSVPTSVVGFHLRNFAQFVAAGTYDLDEDETWKQQEAALAAKAAKAAEGDSVTVRPKLDFNAMKDQTWEFVDKYVHSDAFSAVAFTEAGIGDLMGTNDIPEAKAEATATKSRGLKAAAPR